MRRRNERKSSSPSLDCEAGLGLKMQLQPTDSCSCHGNDGGGPFFNRTSNQLACLNDIYGVANDGVVVQRSFHNTAFGASGSMAVSGKDLFTVSQWQELERQKMINKYILASIPVPPQLLLPTSTDPPSLSQCNTSSLDLRFSSSSGSDPEPWRCKRTDGKKWRCSRDVAPDQKYCERHAHKNRPRSRKLVEVSSHNTSSNINPPKPLFLAANINPSTNITSTITLLRSASQFPTVTSATSYDQTRCIEWFMRGGSSSDKNPVSTSKQQQWEQAMQISSSRMELNRDNTDHNKNMSVYLPYFEDKQGFMSLNPYIPDTSSLRKMDKNQNQLSDGQCCNSILDSRMKSLQGEVSLCAADRSLTQTTRHFIDAWEKEGFEGIISSNKGLSSASLSKKFSPSSSLSLSMSGWSDNGNDDLGIGVIGTDRDSNCDGILRSQWMNPASWMNSSPPGGPLGEALGLGSATTRGGSNLASPHCHRNSINANAVTNSSCCSKSSREDGSHALNLIG